MEGVIDQVVRGIAAADLEDDQLPRLRVPELREELRRRNLRVTGRKPELLARLRAALLVERDHVADNDEENIADLIDDEEEDDFEDARAVNAEGLPGRGNRDVRLRNPVNDGREYNDEDDDDGANSERANRTPVIQRREESRVLLTFKDVEGSLEKFSGDDHTNVQQWLDDFEEMAELCKWNEIQKIAYAKRLLGGSAKMFVSYEKCAKTWKKLKQSLKDEFEEAVDCLKIHRELSKRKKKTEETLQEYAYKMLQIASPAKLKVQDVIQYIIEGIPDDVVNKAVLYGAKDFKQLKEKFGQYEKMKQEMSKSKARPPEKKLEKTGRPQSYNQGRRGSPGGVVSTSGKKTSTKCYNCGGDDHVSAMCPEKGKGKKCFKCGEFGHIASECPPKSKEVYLVSRPAKEKYQKEITIKDSKILALVDTGSDLTLMSMKEYKNLGSPPLCNKQVCFEGLGAEVTETLGMFTTSMMAENYEFHVDFHVVPDSILRRSVILGTDFLDQVELRVRRGTVTFFKLDGDDSTDEETKPYIYKINTVDETKELELSHIKEEHYREEIKKIVSNYKPEATRDVGIRAKIILTSDKPVVSRPRRLAPSERKEVNDLMSSWLEEGIIRPSTSEYASPIVLIKKKDGTLRICVDYRKINAIMLRPLSPLPLIEDSIDALAEDVWFTLIDLKNGFFHVWMDEGSIKYTAFVTPDGQYEFVRLPFGLCIGPTVFQSYINYIFKDLIRDGIVVVYMDDIIIKSKTSEEHLRRVKLVIKDAAKHGLIIKWEKCQFFKTTVDYLGYVICRGTVRPSETKTLAVRDFPRPTTVKSVQSFLGLTGYFRKFIPGYSLIARPLTELLKKDVKFVFGMREIEAFEKLKAALVCEPVLKLYCHGAETELHTDASRLGYGMILLQKDCNDGKFHPVYYASGKTTDAESRYSSYELEVLAIVKALEKFRVYLINIAFKIVTDCQAFTATVNKEKVCLRVARWVILLADFNYSIEHRPGKNMPHVDALSRHSLPEVLYVCENDDGLIARLRSAQDKDECLKQIIDAASRNEANGYLLRNKLLYRSVGGEPLVVVPKSMEAQVIKKAHERGHFGVTKTEAIVKRDFWFKEMRPKVEQVVANCIDCILAERKQGKQEGLLHPIYKGDTPLDTYHIDHLGPMTNTPKRYKHIFVVVDAFSKFVWLYPTKSTDTAEVLHRLRSQSSIFGNPRRIISDRGTAFTSRDFQEYCESEKIEHSLIVTGIPRGNGQVERVNRTLIPLLTKMAAPTPENWYKHVENVQKYLNATPSRSTGQAPCQLLFGVNMRFKDDWNLKELLEKEWTTQFEEDRKELREKAREKIRKTQEENRRGFNKHRKPAHVYEEGDLVAIQRTQFGPGLKLKGKFLGPYRITKLLRGDRYVVEKIGEHEGPQHTSTAADHMKPWGMSSKESYKTTDVASDDDN